MLHINHVCNCLPSIKNASFSHPIFLLRFSYTSLSDQVDRTTSFQTFPYSGSNVALFNFLFLWQSRDRVEILISVQNNLGTVSNFMTQPVSVDWTRISMHKFLWCHPVPLKTLSEIWKSIKYFYANIPSPKNEMTFRLWAITVYRSDGASFFCNIAVSRLRIQWMRNIKIQYKQGR